MVRNRTRVVLSVQHPRRYRRLWRTASKKPPKSSGCSTLPGMDDFYRDYILDHYRNPRNFGHLERPDVTGRRFESVVRRHDPHGTQTRREPQGGRRAVLRQRMRDQSGVGLDVDRDDQRHAARGRRETLERGGARERRHRHQSDADEVRDARPARAQECGDRRSSPPGPTRNNRRRRPTSSTPPPGSPARSCSRSPA